jgi:hypothetical protein
MESDSEQSNDPVSLVKIWQESAEFHDFIDKIGLAARLFQASVDDYTASLKCAKAKNNIPSSIYKILNRILVLSYYEAMGLELRTEIWDALLQTSWELRHSVLSFLILIAQTVLKRLLGYVYSGGHERRAPSIHSDRLVEEAKCVVKQEKEAAEDTDDASSSDGSSDISYSEDSIDDIAADLSTYVTCLMDLEPMMKRPIPDPQREQSVSDPLFLEDRHPHQYYAELIKARFPKAEPKLVEQLGQAS